MARYGWNYDRPDWNREYEYDRPGAYAGGRFGGGYYGAGERLGGYGAGERLGGGYGTEYHPGLGGYYGGAYTRGREYGGRGGRGGADYGGGYDRDLGDRLQEGWRGLRRGARQAFRAGQGRDWGDRLQEGWNEANRGIRRGFGGEPRGRYAGYGREYDRGW